MTAAQTGLRGLGSASHQRLPWGLLGLTAVGLLAMAFYYQYGMELQPCVMCIYIRLAVFGILIAAIIGAMAPKVFAVRWLGLGVWALSIYYGFVFSGRLIKIQNPVPGEFGAGCNFLPDFPEWMPLHEWFPGAFMPTASCSDPPWTWLGLSMAEWMLVTFWVYAVAFAVVLISMAVSFFSSRTTSAHA